MTAWWVAMSKTPSTLPLSNFRATSRSSSACTSGPRSPWPRPGGLGGTVVVGAAVVVVVGTVVVVVDEVVVVGTTIEADSPSARVHAPATRASAVDTASNRRGSTSRTIGHQYER